MSIPIERMKIITDEQKLRGNAKKTNKHKGIRVGMKLIKFIAANDIKCIGLAAPQVGISERVFVLFDGSEFAIFVNPRITQVGAMEEENIEGCLSLPGRQFKVTRPTSVFVKDAVRTKPFELTGLTARAWLHELDHLKGKLISDIGEEVFDEETTKVL